MRDDSTVRPGERIEATRRLSPKAYACSEETERDRHYDTIIGGQQPKFGKTATMCSRQSTIVSFLLHM
jgi:hypothetical protein